MATGIIRNARTVEKKNAADSLHLFCRNSPKPGIMNDAKTSTTIPAFFSNFPICLHFAQSVPFGTQPAHLIPHGTLKNLKFNGRAPPLITWKHHSGNAKSFKVGIFEAASVLTTLVGISNTKIKTICTPVSKKPRFQAPACLHASRQNQAGNKTLKNSFAQKLPRKRTFY